MNERNFVGLSVTPDGYIACGSEDNSVYTYFATLPTPLARHRFSAAEGCADSVCFFMRHCLLQGNMMSSCRAPFLTCTGLIFCTI